MTIRRGILGAAMTDAKAHGVTGPTRARWEQITTYACGHQTVTPRDWVPVAIAAALRTETPVVTVCPACGEVEARMLAKAEADQVVAQKMANGAYATRSLIHPAPSVYRTTADSCSCQGFARFGYCKHWARVRQLEASR